MLMTIQAVFEHGVLRPLLPLSLPEGQRVELQLGTAEDYDPVLERMRAAKDLDELYAIVDSLPPDDDDYDLCQALNENRRLSGSPPVYPDLEPKK